MKNNEVENLRKINNNGDVLLNQLKVYEEKVNNLSKENDELKKKGKYFGGNNSSMKESILNGSIVDKLNELDFKLDNGMDLKDYFDYLKEEVLTEND